MKYLIFFIIAATPRLLNAQISLEHNFSEGYVYSHILEDGELIYSHSYATGESPNYSITLTFYDINYQQIGGTTLESNAPFVIPGYVSRNLFNNDNEIEFLITSGSFVDWTLLTSIKSINGLTLYEIENCNSSVVKNTEDGAKWITHIYTDEEDVTAYHMRVYSLPGTLPSGLAENGNGELLAYPNPTKSFINIPAAGATQIEVYNTRGQKVIEMPTNGSSFQQVPTSQLAPGTYIYQTSSKQEVKPGKMFVVE